MLLGKRGQEGKKIESACNAGAQSAMRGQEGVKELDRLLVE